MIDEGFHLHNNHLPLRIVNRYLNRYGSFVSNTSTTQHLSTIFGKQRGNPVLFSTLELDFPDLYDEKVHIPRVGRVSASSNVSLIPVRV